MSTIKALPTGPESWDFYSINSDVFLFSLELTNFDLEKKTFGLSWIVWQTSGEDFEYVEAMQFILTEALFVRRATSVKVVVPLSDPTTMRLISKSGFIEGREFGAGTKRARRYSCDRYDLVRNIAERLMGEHLDTNVWSFGFDSAKKRLGVCKYAEHLISLSRYLVDLHSLEEVDQVIRHEIAHALAGSKAGHGTKWKKIATELGYNHKKISGDEIGNATAKLIGTCPNAHTVYRHRKPKTPLSCSKCAPRFDRRFLITWTAR